MTSLNHWQGQGISNIRLEREHQIDLGYDLDHDNECHSPTDLLRIGACYADLAALVMEGDEPTEVWDKEGKHPLWPDVGVPWTPEDTAVGNAVKAAAFIAAALDLEHALQMEGE